MTIPALDPDAELVIYRVAQEALTNVGRHSGAHRASLTLQVVGAELVMTVSDHGRGLDGGGEPGTGIRGMRERAALIGAQLRVGVGEDGTGCAVRLWISPDRERARR